MSVLELDAGNSRLKWRLLGSSGVTARGFLMNDDHWVEGLHALLSSMSNVDSVRGAIVSGDERFYLLNDAVQRFLKVPLLRATVKPDWHGVRVAYTATLGVDRWLVMLAANQLGGAGYKLVVSLGTAMTLDVLDHNGLHLGGYIVPGVGLMKRMLSSNTAQLPLLDCDASSCQPGTNTADCINNGVLAMSAAMVNAQQSNYRDCVVYLTGGDAQLLAPHIDGKCCCFPELVMDGLALAFE